MGRGGPLTAGPELRCFSGPRAEETERTGRRGIGREKSSHPHQAPSVTEDAGAEWPSEKSRVRRGNSPR